MSPATKNSNNTVRRKRKAGEEEMKEEQEHEFVASRKSRIREDLDTLHKEMEVAQRARKAGNFVRKTPRNAMKNRTLKRKQLESDDEHLMSEMDDGRSRRLRGPQAAQDEEVIRGSYAFGDSTSAFEQTEGSDSGEEEAGVENDNDDSDEGQLGEETELEGDDSEGEGPGDECDGDQTDYASGLEDSRGGSLKSSDPKKLKRGPKRKLYRVRTFKTMKLAQRHGDALDAHARGKPRLAIQKLKQVAKEAPSAPQIYSLLGMVYDDMFKESQRKREEGNSTSLPIHVYTGEQTFDDEVTPVPELGKELKLAKKAYGSHHVSALLCKRDYSLWVRAADSAASIAGMHTEVMLLPSLPEEVQNYHRCEKHRWLKEAKNDYSAADSQKPPGLDVPAKLAMTLIDLGKLSEALTLLTDLKNRHPVDFNQSYSIWRLFSDLMLKLEFECDKWNRGDHRNEDYMLKRWLRKFSKSFDCRERRLQYLTKALAAAAGGNNSSKLLVWVDQRARSISATTKEANEIDGAEDASDGKSGKSGKPIPQSEQIVEFEKEREQMKLQFQFELDSFDRTTRDADEGQVPTRETARAALVKAQKAKLVELAAGFHMRTNDRQISEASSAVVANLEEMKDSAGPSSSCLRPTASSKTVCSIATDLVRLMLEMNLPYGGQLVCETVSMYFKSRAVGIEQRLQAHRRFHEEQEQPTSIFVLKQVSYDNNSDGEADSDDPLSDDDDLLSEHSTGLIIQMKQGILPPELKVFYGLCFGFVVNRTFVTVKLLEHVFALDQEPSTWLSEPVVDTNVRPNPEWLQVQLSTTGRLTRTAAFHIISKCLENPAFKVPARSLSDLFSKHADELMASGFVQSAIDFKADYTIGGVRRAQVFDVLVAAARCQVDVLDGMLGNKSSNTNQCEEKILDLLDSLVVFLDALWVQTDGSIPESCIGILSVMDKTIALLASFEGAATESFVLRFLEKLEPFINVLCGIPKGIPSAGNLNELGSFPFSDSWLSDKTKLIALRAHNCAVAMSCSHFSGWENAEFSTSLLRETRAEYVMCLSFAGNCTSGCLPADLVDMVRQMWDGVRKFQPTMTFDFSAQFEALASSASYNDILERFAAARESHQVHRFGEDVSLKILLTYSKYHMLALQSGDASNYSRHLETCMAVLLPLSQFLLHQKIWTSSLGQAAVAQPDILTWRPTYIQEEESESQNTYVRRRMASTPTEGDLQKWFPSENADDPLSNAVCIPPAMLLKMWTVASSEGTADEEGIHLMKQLDSSIRRLRKCHSELNVANMAVIVAADLIKLASSPSCRNPFVCIQHAVMFASQGRKGGTTVDVFKSPLPKHHECQPWQALVILARADCLQTVYFYEEAAYLCAFVATVCSLHRDNDVPELEWNEKWDVVALQTYNLSVFLRAAANTIVREHGKKHETSIQWDDKVKEELQHARSTGVSMMSATAQGGERHGTSMNRTALPVPKSLAKTGSTPANLRAAKPIAAV